MIPDKPRRRWLQFTLVEILASIFIVALVVGILVPGLKHSANTPPNHPPNDRSR